MFSMSRLPFLLLIVATTLGVLGLLWRVLDTSSPPIRIGVLHSLTGTMAISEAPLVDGVTLAVEEINAAGGLLGRPVAMIVADCRSDWLFCANEAERLITQERVSALFGCWTSACRKAVKPVVERHQHLLFYPVQYEGMEQSPHIIYTGSAPNQQIVPGTRWAMEQFGRRLFLVGSDYIFPRTAHLIMRDLIETSNGEIVGEYYLPLGGKDFAAVIEAIRRTQPDVVLNTVNGDSNYALFAALREAGLQDLPVVSFSIAETEMLVFGGQHLTHHYAVWSYFQSVPRPENQRFVAAFQRRFGAERAVSDPVEAAYTSVHLWAQAVRDERADEPFRINQAILRQSWNAPSAIYSIDGMTRHTWKMVRVGRARSDGQFDIVFSSSAPLRPSPWPFYRRRDAWQSLLTRAGLNVDSVSHIEDQHSENPQ